MAAPSLPPFFALTAKFSLWSSRLHHIHQYLSQMTKAHSPHSPSQSQPLKYTKSSLVNHIPWLETGCTNNCTSDHNQRWKLNGRLLGAEGTLVVITLHRGPGKVILILQSLCSKFYSSRPVLIIRWLLKPKVVFNPPQTKLHCMSSQLNTMFDITLPKQLSFLTLLQQHF